MSEEEGKQIFWSRDEKGNIIPLSMSIKLYDGFLEKAKIIYKDDAEILDFINQEIMNQEEIKIVFTPLLNFEFNNITKKCDLEGYNYGCKGVLVEDIDADICANHCLEPKYSYDEWLRMTDGLLKKKISLCIYENSKPKDFEDFFKKKIKNLKQKTKVLLKEE